MGDDDFTGWIEISLPGKINSICLLENHLTTKQHVLTKISVVESQVYIHNAKLIQPAVPASIHFAFPRVYFGSG